ncbi:MAG: hypothetical protein J6M60_05395 [Clostridia bacterium]|nr:hypothetical protein [Clostridia bacterium]
MKKVIWILIAIVVVVGISYFATRELNKAEKNENNITNTSSTITKKDSKENKVNETSNVQKNTVENNIENTTNKENTVENTIVEENSTKDSETVPQTEEEKAISIVKKDWGANDVNVKIAIEGINEDGTYIVTVRDSSTTEAMAFYKVNVKNNSFDKTEMY